MQRLANEFNLSETTFVLPPDNPQHHARVRIFTPRCRAAVRRPPECRHRLCAGAARRQTRRNTTCSRNSAGLVRVHVLRDAQKQITGARISAPQSLSIDISDPGRRDRGLRRPERGRSILTTGHTPLVASVGTPFVIAELASEAALTRASPDMGAFRAAAARFPELAGRFALHLYVRRDGDATRLRTRMFAPLMRRARGSRHRQRQCGARGAADLAGTWRKRRSHLRHRARRGDGAAEPDRRDGAQDGGGSGQRDRRR